MSSKIKDFLEHPLTSLIGNDVFPGLGTLAQVYSGIVPPDVPSGKYGSSPQGADYAQPATATETPETGQEVLPATQATPTTVNGSDYYQNLAKTSNDPHVQVAAISWLNQNDPANSPKPTSGVTTTPPVATGPAATGPVTTAPDGYTDPSSINLGTDTQTDTSTDGSTADPTGPGINPTGTYTPEQYKSDILQNPNASTADLYRAAYALNNTRNDIATGNTDPFGVGTQPGVALTPQQVISIQKGLGSSYDPALDDINARIKEAETSSTATSAQDKLEQNARQGLLKAYQSRSGDIGTQNAKVTSAIAAQSAIDSYKQSDGTYNIPPSALGDLVIKTATLLNGNGSVSNDQLAAIQQDTAKGKVAKALGFLGINAGGSTQAVAANLAKIINTQGLVAEQNRDQELYGLEQVSLPTDLDPDRIDAITQAFESNFPSYTQYLKTGQVSGGSITDDPGSTDATIPNQTSGSSNTPPVPTRNADGTYSIPSNFNSVGGDTNTAMNVIIPSSSHLAYVNNNPGNIKFANQPGATRGANGFAKFSTPQAGFNAIIALTNNYAKNGHTLSSYLTAYAPPSENNTNQYIADVVKQTGINPNIKLSNLSPSQKIKLAQAIAVNESSSQFT